MGWGIIKDDDGFSGRIETCDKIIQHRDNCVAVDAALDHIGAKVATASQQAQHVEALAPAAIEQGSLALGLPGIGDGGKQGETRFIIKVEVDVALVLLSLELFKKLLFGSEGGIIALRSE